MRLMGIDYGTKRVGIALSDESGTLAFPEATLDNDATLMERVAKLANECGIERIVLGQSLNYKNEPNKLMERIEPFKAKLEAAGFEIVYEPEHMTSSAAARLQGEHVELDASAAALILQSYLDRMKHTNG